MPRLDHPITQSLPFAIAILLALATQGPHIAAQTQAQQFRSRIAGKPQPPQRMAPQANVRPLPVERRRAAPRKTPIAQALHLDAVKPQNHIAETAANREPVKVFSADDTPIQPKTKFPARPTKAPTSNGKKITPNKWVKPLFTAISSLSVVIGLFLMIAYVAKRKMPKSRSGLSSEVIELLGRVSLVPRQDMQLVRVGKKLLLLCVTATGAETLTEITDPDEVERLTTAAQQGRSGSVTATFRDVLKQLGGEAAPKGFWGGQSQQDGLTAAISRDAKPTEQNVKALHG